MAGSVRTQERCPTCGGAFRRQLIDCRSRRKVEEKIILSCPSCHTRPERYFVDGRYIRDEHGAVGYIFTDENGEPLANYGDADSILKAIRAEMKAGTFLSTRWNKRVVGQYRVEVACEDWLKHVEAELSETYSEHQRRFFVRYINPDIGGVDIRKLRGIDITRFRERLCALGKSENTVRGILTALRTCLSWLRSQDVIDRVPAFPSLRPVPRAHVGWIEPVDQARGIAFLREDMRLLVETMFALGARPAEAVALKVRDLRDGAIRVERAVDRKRNLKATKTGAIMEKVIAPDLYARIELEAKGKLPEAFLFVNHVGKPFHPSQVSWKWRKAADKAGIPACLYVASRHSRVSCLRMELERRVAEELRKELAHKNVTTTMRHYVRERE